MGPQPNHQKLLLVDPQLPAGAEIIIYNMNKPDHFAEMVTTMYA
jgi:hypothetical protein